MLSFGIGTYFESARWAEVAKRAGDVQTITRVAKVLTHGVSGGVVQDLQGGKFAHGFMSAGVTQAVAPGLSNIQNDFAQLMAAAVVGGSVSAATGGKFANGAFTAAFQAAFNEIAHEDIDAAAEARRLGVEPESVVTDWNAWDFEKHYLFRDQNGEVRAVGPANMGLPPVAGPTRWLRAFFGRGFPTKLNRGGRMQPFDAKGRYLPYAANPGIKMSPAAQLGAGFSQGFAEGYTGVPAAAPVGRLGSLGQNVGKVLGTIAGWF